MNNIEDIYICTPINKITNVITSQSGCSESVLLDRQSILQLIEKLQQRNNELKKQLKIETKNQLNNRRYYYYKATTKIHGKVKNQRYSTFDLKGFEELLENGRLINELNKQIFQIKKQKELSI